MDSFKTKEDRIYDEAIYTKVAEEIESSSIHKGLWAKALAESEGNLEIQKALYIKFRVQSIKDEVDPAKQEYENLQFQLRVDKLIKNGYVIMFVIVLILGVIFSRG